VETLDPRVLRRLPQLNAHQLDLPLHALRQKMPARQFRAVVAADCRWLSALRHDRIQHSRHSPAGETRVHFQSQTLPRVRIHHTQHRIARPHSSASCRKSNAHSWFAALRATNGLPSRTRCSDPKRSDNCCMACNFCQLPGGRGAPRLKSSRNPDLGTSPATRIDKTEWHPRLWCLLSAVGCCFTATVFLQDK
jgi:hypothetical protein